MIATAEKEQGFDDPRVQDLTGERGEEFLVWVDEAFDDMVRKKIRDGEDVPLDIEREFDFHHGYGERFDWVDPNDVNNIERSVQVGLSRVDDVLQVSFFAVASKEYVLPDGSGERKFNETIILDSLANISPSNLASYLESTFNSASSWRLEDLVSSSPLQSYPNH